MNLRPYQTDIVSRTRRALSNSRSALVVLGCGGGKSVIAGTIAKMATDKSNRVLFLVHRQELCQQIAQTFNACGVNSDLCSIEMVQSLARHPERIKAPALVIVDECHHAQAAGYQKVLDACGKAYRIGFTATPERLDGKKISEVFRERVDGPSVSWLINNKFLSPYAAYNYPDVDTSNLRKRAGEFRREDVAQAMGKFQYGHAVKNWLNIAKGKKTIVYNHSILAALNTAEAYRAAGISAAEIDGATPKAEREKIVSEFRAGKIMVLCNVDLFGEGFDVPDCECVQLLRPTASFTVFVQQSMRSMRYKEGKTAIILDHTGNIERFGVPTCWKAPASRKKKKAMEFPTAKTCNNCFAVYEVNSPAEYRKPCPCCGFVAVAEHEADERTVLDVDLQAIAGGVPSLSNVIESVEDCKTFEDLEQYQKQQGYKRGWVFYQAKFRHIRISARAMGQAMMCLKHN